MKKAIPSWGSRICPPPPVGDRNKTYKINLQTTLHLLNSLAGSILIYKHQTSSLKNTQDNTLNVSCVKYLGDPL